MGLACLQFEHRPLQSRRRLLQPIDERAQKKQDRDRRDRGRRTDGRKNPVSREFRPPDEVADAPSGIGRDGNGNLADLRAVGHGEAKAFDQVSVGDLLDEASIEKSDAHEQVFAPAKLRNRVGFGTIFITLTAAGRPRSSSRWAS